MKSAIHMTFRVASVALATTLVACGGGGGASPPPPPSAVLTPGIWNTIDVDSSRKFIGVVTTSGSGGEVWAMTKNETAGTVQMFTGTVSASGVDFATNQGSLLAFSATTGWTNDPAQTLTLPKFTTANQQVFQFRNVSHTTRLHDLWKNSAKLNDSNDWNGSWTLTERVSFDNQPLDLTYAWEVDPAGVITGTKSIPGQEACGVSGEVLPLEKAVVRISVSYNCDSKISTFTGISFPQTVNDAGKVLTRAVWLKGPGTEAKFAIQLFTRSTPR